MTMNSSLLVGTSFAGSLSIAINPAWVVDISSTTFASTDVPGGVITVTDNSNGNTMTVTAESGNNVQVVTDKGGASSTTTESFSTFWL